MNELTSVASFFEKPIYETWSFAGNIQTTKKAYAHTLEKELNLSSDLHSWMPIARDHGRWAELVEKELSLAPGTYKPYKLRSTNHLA